MKKHRMVSLVALLIFGFVAACQKHGWQEYKYPNDGFAISAPLKPVPQPPAFEELLSRNYVINLGRSTEVTFGAGDLGVDDDVARTQLLPNLKKMSVQATATKLVSEKEISLDNNAGIEYEVETRDSHVRVRYYIVKGKILGLGSFAPAGEPLAPDTGRIFDSLRLLNSAR